MMFSRSVIENLFGQHRSLGHRTVVLRRKLNTHLRRHLQSFDSQYFGRRSLVTNTAEQFELTRQESAGCPFHHPVSRQSSVTEMKRRIVSSQYCLPFEQIPSPSGLPIVGTLLDFIRAGGSGYLHQYCDKRHQMLGPIYREKLGELDTVFISDVDLIQKVFRYEGKYPKHLVPEAWTIYNESRGIKRGLFFMDGEDWAAQRSALNKFFLKPNVINSNMSSIDEVIEDFINIYQKRMNQQGNPDGLLVDGLKNELYNLSIESLGTTIFNRRLGCFDSQNNEKFPGIQEFVDCVQQIFAESATLQLVPPKLAYSLKLPVWKRFETAAQKSLDFALQLVKENQVHSCNDENDNMLKMMVQGGQLELGEISRIVVDLFLAAADTTSHANQWVLYLLSRNRRVQEAVYKEIQSVTNGAPVEEKHLTHLSIVKGVIKEAHRLYPVAPFLTRYLSEDLNLGGYLVPKGQLVVMSLYTTGRKEKYFQNANSFMPERWIRHKQTGRNQVKFNHACLPFGIGVRSCIGKRVADVQMQFLISKLIQRFRILPTSEEEIQIKLKMITTPEKPVDLILQQR